MVQKIPTPNPQWRIESSKEQQALYALAREQLEQEKKLQELNKGT